MFVPPHPHIQKFVLTVYVDEQVGVVSLCVTDFCFRHSSVQRVVFDTRLLLTLSAERMLSGFAF